MTQTGKQALGNIFIAAGTGWLVLAMALGVRTWVAMISVVIMMAGFVLLIAAKTGSD